MDYIYLSIVNISLETCVEEIFFGESLKIETEFFIDFKTEYCDTVVI